jgi:uncharacterized Zn finger protein (UPF0148 family)
MSTPKETEQDLIQKKVLEFKRHTGQIICPVCRMKMKSHCKDRYQRCMSVYVARALLPKR